MSLSVDGLHAKPVGTESWMIIGGLEKPVLPQLATTKPMRSVNRGITNVIWEVTVELGEG